MHKTKKTVFFLFLITQTEMLAQCSMCKAVAESSIEGGGVIGAGLNSGILYLMAFPYLLLMVFAITWFLANKKQSA